MSYPAKSNAAVDAEVSLGINTLFEQPWWLDAVVPGAWGRSRCQVTAEWLHDCPA